MKINRNLKNILSLFSFEFVSRLLGFIAVTYLARILGTEGFGLINIGLAVLSYAMIFGNSGLNLVGTRKIAAGVDDPGKYTGNILFTRFFLSILVYLISALAVYMFVESEEAVKVILVYNLFLIPSAFLLEWFFHGHQKMDIIAIGRIAGIGSYLIFVLIFVNKAEDTLQTAAGWVFGGIIHSILLFYIFIKNKYPVKLHINWRNFTFLIKESFPLVSANAITQFVTMFPVIYIGIVLTESDAGLYSAAYKLIVLFLVFDRVFNALFFPKIIKCVKETPDNLENIFNKILRIITTLTFSLALFIIVLNEHLIEIIFGSSFVDAASAFKILTGVFIFTLINSVFTYTLVAMNKESIYTASLFWSMVIFLVVTFVFTGSHGLVAPAIALVIFEMSSLLLMANKLRREVSFNFIRTVVLPVLFVLAVSAAFIIFNVGIAIQLAILIFVCVPLIILICGLSLNEIKFIKKVFI